MRNNNNKKYKTLLDTGRLLFCLLAFSLLGSLLPTALSLETQTRAISSSGAIMYAANSTLLATDSTPEGPIPYKIDGKSGYQTGSTYTVTAGVHTIELPSPYSSPISNITYYFVYWQDGPTENPRNITLEPNTTVNLHGIYSTTSEPPPPPPPPSGDMPLDYVGYTGFETSNFFTEFGLNSWVSRTGSGGNDYWYDRVTSPVYKGGYALDFGIGPSVPERLTFSYTLQGNLQNEMYQSSWLYFPSTYDMGIVRWHDLFELRGQTINEAAGRLSIVLEGDYWQLAMGSVFGNSWSNYDPDWAVRVYPTTGDYEISPYGSRPCTVLAANPVLSSNTQFPLGEWFRLDIYVKRSTSSDGRVAIIINGVTLLEVQGNTAWIQDATTRCYGWRWYGQLGSSKVRRYYIDEVYVYDYRLEEG